MPAHVANAPKLCLALCLSAGLSACSNAKPGAKAEKKPEVAPLPATDKEAKLSAVDLPNPEEVQVRNISYAGSGCAAKTVSTNISPDAKAITLLFAEYSASAGPGIDPLEARKNCQITLDLHTPPGYSYSLFKLDVRGFADLEPSVLGTLKATFYFQGQQISSTFSKTLTGPKSDNYQSSTSTEVNDAVFSSCDGASRALNINTEVSIDNSQATSSFGHMTVDSIDGEFTHRYAIKWKKCAEPTPSPAPTPSPTPAPTSPLAGSTFIAVGPGAGSAEPVRIFDARHPAAAVATFFPFGVPYTGGYRVALADVNGDGMIDLIAGTDQGIAPRVVVIDGATSRPILDFTPFSGTGGVYVAAGDTDGDGKAEIVVAAGAGVEPEVKVYALSGQMVRKVLVYEPEFKAGVRIAMGDINGDGTLDIVTSTPPGGGPRVKVLSGRDLATMADRLVYEPEFRGGVWIAVGDIDGDGKAEIFTGADVGGGPRVRVFSSTDFTPRSDFFAYDASLRSGVRVGAVDANGDGRFEMLVAPGVGGGPQIRIMDPLKGVDTLAGSFFGADPNSRAGFYVSGAVAARKP